MSQSNVEVPPVATPHAAATPPAAPVAAATPPIAPTPAPVVATEVQTTADPNWLTPRLDQAKKAAQSALLKALGVKDEAEAKALLDRAKAAADAEKTALEKANSEIASLKGTTARVELLEKTVKARADLELATLTEGQRIAVAKIAGDDPARTLDAIDTLKPTWIVAAPPPAVPAVVAPVAAPPAPVVAPPPPANTSPPPTAPGGAAGSPPDRKAEYAALKTKNPHAAAIYLNRYTDEIYPRA
jgi:hypothetical protein